MVELVPAVSLCRDEACSFQHVKVLRDRLSRRTQPMPHRQSRADLEQGLTVPLGQLVENRPSRSVGQSFEHVTQSRDNRQATACLSRSSATHLVAELRGSVVDIEVYQRGYGCVIRNGSFGAATPDEMNESRLVGYHLDTRDASHRQWAAKHLFGELPQTRGRSRIVARGVNLGQLRQTA
jgi:hypothetical protein